MSFIFPSGIVATVIGFNEILLKQCSEYLCYLIIIKDINMYINSAFVVPKFYNILS